MDASYDADTGSIACDVHTLWGQPGHWLDGAVNIALAQTMGEVGLVETDDHAGDDAWLASSWSKLPNLSPVID